jgi:hypothetical protein
MSPNTTALLLVRVILHHSHLLSQALSSSETPPAPHSASLFFNPSQLHSLSHPPLAPLRLAQPVTHRLAPSIPLPYFYSLARCPQSLLVGPAQPPVEGPEAGRKLVAKERHPHNRVCPRPLGHGWGNGHTINAIYCKRKYQSVGAPLTRMSSAPSALPSGSLSVEVQYPACQATLIPKTLVPTT